MRGLMVVALIVVVSVAAFVLLNPIGAASVWLVLTGYPIEPPPIAEGQITPRDWPGGEPANTKLTALLRKRFPVGSDPRWLRGVMKDQGFGVEIVGPIDPTSHAATFEWGSAVCKQYMTVIWREDSRGHIADITGAYSTACL